MGIKDKIKKYLRGAKSFVLSPLYGFKFLRRQLGVPFKYKVRLRDKRFIEAIRGALGSLEKNDLDPSIIQSEFEGMTGVPLPISGDLRTILKDVMYTLQNEVYLEFTDRFTKTNLSRSFIATVMPQVIIGFAGALIIFVFGTPLSYIYALLYFVPLTLYNFVLSKIFFPYKHIVLRVLWSSITLILAVGLPFTINYIIPLLQGK